MQATLEKMEHPLRAGRPAGAGFPDRFEPETAQAPHDGRLFSLEQRARLRGRHPRRTGPVAGRTYVAGVDLSGRTGPEARRLARLVAPWGAPVTITIGEVGPDPALSIVQHYRWAQEPPWVQAPRLLHLLGGLWGCRRIAVEGLGEGELLGRLLRRQLAPTVVEPLPPTGQGRLRLGLGLLAALDAGRVEMHAHDGSDHWQEFWAQIVRARARRGDGGAFDFYVEPSTGDDGFLMSLALAVEAARALQSAASRRAAEAVPA